MRDKVLITPKDRQTHAHMNATLELLPINSDAALTVGITVRPQPFVNTDLDFPTYLFTFTVFWTVLGLCTGQALHFVTVSPGEGCVKWHLTKSTAWNDG